MFAPDDTGPGPVVSDCQVELLKGMATSFDEVTVQLRSPCFLATGRAEALHYASTLPGDDADRRIVVYRPNRPLRLLRFDVGGPDWRAVLAGMDVAPGAPAAVAVAVLALGYDGLMLGDGGGGHHVVLGSSDVVDHAWTEPLAAAPSP